MLMLLGAISAYSQSSPKPVQSTAAFDEASFNFLSDTTSILSLIDSLIHLPYDSVQGSTMAVRLGYNSNVVSAARTLNFNQFGLSPGISYFHKSGFYADVSGYWSKQYVPDYYLTIASLGYMHSITPRWTILPEYSRYIYSPSDSSKENDYKNSAGISNFINLKPVMLRFDYSYYFGIKQAHRIMPGITLNIEKKNWKGIKRILLFPSFNLLTGSEQIDNVKRTATPYTTKPAEILYRIKNNLPLYYITQTTHTKTKYGILNYSFSLPLSISYHDWTFLASYTYNIPRALPGEHLDLTKSGYFSFSVSRYISFKTSSKKVF